MTNLSQNVEDLFTFQHKVERQTQQTTLYTIAQTQNKRSQTKRDGSVSGPPTRKNNQKKVHNYKLPCEYNNHENYHCSQS